MLDIFSNVNSPEDYLELTEVYIVMEYLPHSLDELLFEEVSEKVALTILYRLLLCLKFMHSANLIHRDLKPENVLLTKDCEVKICDFGFTRNLNDVKAKNPNGRKQRPLSA